ncbi:YodC family protein [Paraburkholderia sp.]|uniref:YodC family protein n=1 Tax=Paraburkholderia sp. TaxID=1926495 RepID=UPI002388D758|nr:YodC family protein [Paraburkholderia sp.]MDE1179540.1 YodC family protein [Paraburkholderia sp.]
MFRARNKNFRAGDVLTLKSGGCPMTATWVGPVLFAPGTWLICQWFDDAGDMRQEMFPKETLERARDALPA